jgi:hypothetical protein
MGLISGVMKLQSVFNGNVGTNKQPDLHGNCSVVNINFWNIKLSHFIISCFMLYCQRHHYDHKMSVLTFDIDGSLYTVIFWDQYNQMPHQITVVTYHVRTCITAVATFSTKITYDNCNLMWHLIVLVPEDHGI